MRRSTPIVLPVLGIILLLIVVVISGWDAPDTTASWVALFGSLALGGLFCYAGASKLTRLRQFGRSLRDFPLIRQLARTQRSALWLAELISGTELILGVALLTGRYVMWTAAAALVLLAAFTFGLAVAWATKSTASCGCLRQSKKPVAVGHIARNIVVMLLAGTVIAVYAELAPSARMHEVAWAGGSWLPAAGAALACLVWVGLDTARRRWRPAHAVDVLGSGAARRRDDLGSSIALREGSASTGVQAQEPEGWAAFRQVAAREREAAQLLPAIEQPMYALVEEKYVHRGLAEPAEFDAWIAQEAELKAMDDRLSGELQALYTQAAEDLSAPDGSRGVERCLRVALLHWCVTLRRRTMQGYHTAVDGLEDDPDCAGGLVTDQLLMDYFDALAAEEPSQTRAAVAVQALAAVARQTACLGQAQSAHLASAVYWSYIEVAEFLRVNGLEQVAPYLAQAAFQPMLLLYDVEKYRGPTTPLARWFDENADALQEGASSGRLPAHWHGLWLYDRRTGHLMGYRSSSAALTENDVSLPLFLQSLLRKQNMGRLDCSFAEMIERGPSRLGYLCAGSPCGDDIAADRPLTRGHSWWFRRKAGRLGLDEPAARQSTCLEPGGGEGADGSRHTRCADGLTGGGRNRISSSVACLTERLVSPADRQLRCVAEAMGMCADPVEAATKRLRQVLFQGVKLGRFCQLADVQPSPYPGTTEENRRKNVEFAERRLRDQIKAWAEAYAAAELARRREKEAFKAYRANPTPDTRDAYNNASIDRQTAENELREAESQVNNANDTLNKLYEEQEAAPSPPPNFVRCPPDTPQCGNNACTAMAAQAMAASKCLEETGVADHPDVLRPWGDNPVVDPSPLDDANAPAWANCLDSMSDVDPTQRLCWAVDCGHGTETLLTGTGQCGCRQLPPQGSTPGALHSTCGSLDCGEGSYPVLAGAGCRCQPIGGFDAIGSGGIIPRGNLAIPEAPLFREPHVHNLPEEFRPWPPR